MSDIRKVILHTRPNGFCESIAVLLLHVDSPPGANQTDTLLIFNIAKIGDTEKVKDIGPIVDLRSTDHGAAKENAIQGFKATSL